jgi:c-di-GMP-binding flagellar brake protein YcgR
MIMKIACPNCRAEGTVKTDSPPEKDFMLLCPLCKEKFLVKINIRKYYRKKIKIPVRCSLSTVDLHDMKDFGDGTITDISMKGMRVEIYKQSFSPDYFRKGRLLTFFFSLPPRHEELKISGEIVRFNEGDEGHYFNIGVKYSNLDQFAEKQIGFFLLP